MILCMLKASILLLSLLTQLRSEKQMWKQLPDIELAPISYILQFFLHLKHHCFFTGEEKNLYISEHKSNFQLASFRVNLG